MKVNYNVSAMVANNALQRNDKLLSESLGRLSSGLKITNAKDNPSGLAMSRRMNSQIEGLGVANNTSKDAISIVQVADGSLSEIHEVLQRMSELAVQASNGTLTDSDREAIQSEVTLLKEEIERMAQTTQFNGQTILDGSFDYRGYATVGNDPSTAETNPNVKMVSYSDVVEAGNYQITGIDVSFMNLTGTTGVDKKGIFLENGSETNISVKKILEDGSMVDYMPNGMTATVNEDVLTLQDATGKKIQLQIDETFSGTVNLELTGTGAMTMQVFTSGFFLFRYLSLLMFAMAVSSAFSRTLQVFTMMKSASSWLLVSTQPHMSSSWAIIAESYSFIWQPYVAKWYFFMRVNVEKVCKVSNARKLAFAYLNRSHGRQRRQKASDARVKLA